jgi:hypothetical protein
MKSQPICNDIVQNSTRGEFIPRACADESGPGRE